MSEDQLCHLSALKGRYSLDTRRMTVLAQGESFRGVSFTVWKPINLGDPDSNFLPIALITSKDKVVTTQVMSSNERSLRDLATWTISDTKPTTYGSPLEATLQMDEEGIVTLTSNTDGLLILPSIEDAPRTNVESGTEWMSAEQIEKLKGEVPRDPEKGIGAALRRTRAAAEAQAAAQRWGRPTRGAASQANEPGEAAQEHAAPPAGVIGKRRKPRRGLVERRVPGIGTTAPAGHADGSNEEVHEVWNGMASSSGGGETPAAMPPQEPSIPAERQGLWAGISAEHLEDPAVVAERFPVPDGAGGYVGPESAREAAASIGPAAEEPPTGFVKLSDHREAPPARTFSDNAVKIPVEELPGFIAGEPGGQAPKTETVPAPTPAPSGNPEPTAEGSEKGSQKGLWAQLKGLFGGKKK